MKGDHWFIPVDDCIRCAYCEALVGTPGPCDGNDIEEES